jgi:hypothetical protein
LGNGREKIGNGRKEISLGVAVEAEVVWSLVEMENVVGAVGEALVA